ncbi:MAG: hypothetical protein II951_06350 [Bacteroidales bacterium]|nr:hypothetical protein [Bacteroidales bacterium]
MSRRGVIKRCLGAFMMLIAIGVLQGCRDEEESESREKVSTYKVVVLAEESEAIHWIRTGNMAERNIAEGQRGLERQVRLELTVVAKGDEEMMEYVEGIVDDTSVVAIVGPTTSGMAERVARALQGSKKIMISPSATRVEYQRKFADEGNIWNLSQSDIVQIEIMLYQAVTFSYSDVVLLTRGSVIEEGGDSFVDWFAYIAMELGLKVGGIMKYSTPEELEEHVRTLCSEEDATSEDRMVIFNPGGVEDVEVFDATLLDEKEKAAGKLYYPLVMCTDAFSGLIPMSKLYNDDYEGLILYADPESGFGQAYRDRYGEDISDGEAQYYDALLMLSYALTYREEHGGDLQGAMKAVVGGREGKCGGWLPADISECYASLRAGKTPDLSGASGDWTFGGKANSSVEGTCYKHWKKHKDKLETLSYMSVNGGGRSISMKNVVDGLEKWVYELFEDTTKNVAYPYKDENWALIVDGSTSFSDYRFQADVMSMYQMLKKHGYRDDHIIVIAEDNIAYNPDNSEQGVIRTSKGGENVYSREAIDYQLSELTPADLGDIMAGRKSERLPKVVETDEQDNVFVFWSGHGSPGALYWGRKTISYGTMRKYLSDMRHRKLLMAVEACYSGGLGEACEGLPGVLMITAASPYETSKAAVWNKELQVYMTNGFTQGFMEAIKGNPKVVLRDLYYKLAETTTGSHVKVYNESVFGSVYKNDMGEWLERGGE